MKTGRNTLQFIYFYLMPWRRHNSVTMHVTIKCLLHTVSYQNEIYVEFEDNTKHFFIKKPENVNVLVLED